MQEKKEENGLMNSPHIELFSPGCLGTCWHGKYHYFEPWAGCSHDCDYCYARYREVVTATLADRGAMFEHPVPLLAPDLLVKTVRERLAIGDIKILKLSRFTDFFVPEFVENGLCRDLLEVLLESPVERIIITTKGVPDDEIIDLAMRNGRKISYNLAAKPQGKIKLERHVASLESRLEAASRINRSGILTTVHMDPLIPGIEDDPEALTGFFKLLQEYGLRRVMFSFLLLTEPMIEDLRRRLGNASVEAILANYDLEKARQMLPKQKETVYVEVKPDIKNTCIERISRMLREMSFSFVLCSLKSVGGDVTIDAKACPRCDGSFYA
ncbi:MAG: radical SAM protein [Candidatus Ozemobacteraceae bacterium]